MDYIHKNMKHNLQVFNHKLIKCKQKSLKSNAKKYIFQKCTMKGKLIISSSVLQSTTEELRLFAAAICTMQCH